MNNFYFFSCFSRFIFNQIFLAFRSVSKYPVIGINHLHFPYYFSNLFLIKYFWLSEVCHAKHIVIGKNNFYFSSCFSRFIFYQVFVACRSVSKHLVIGMNNLYFYSTFSRFIFNQVFLALRRVSLKTQSYWEEQFLFLFLF